MLPFHGFLKYFSCPHYASGLCERPNCVFRHHDQEQNSCKKEASSFPSYVPSKVSYSKETSQENSARATKEYITPLNHSLPLPPFIICETDDTQLNSKSLKRINPVPLITSEKRPKIVHNDVSEDICKDSLLKTVEISNSSSNSTKEDDIAQSTDKIDKIESKSDGSRQKKSKRLPASFFFETENESDYSKKEKEKSLMTKPSNLEGKKEKEKVDDLTGTESLKTLSRTNKCRVTANSKNFKGLNYRIPRKNAISKEYSSSQNSSTDCSSSIKISNKKSEVISQKNKKEDFPQPEKTTPSSDDQMNNRDEFQFPKDSDDEDSEDVATECRKMFEDYFIDKPEKIPVLQNKEITTVNTSDAEVVNKFIYKKRLARSANSGNIFKSAQNDFKAEPKKMTRLDLDKIVLRRMHIATEATKPEPKVSNVRKDNISCEGIKKNKILTFKSTDDVTLSTPKRCDPVPKSIKPLITIPPNRFYGSKANFGTCNRKDAFFTKDVCTITQSNTKGQPRVSHTPNEISKTSSKALLIMEPTPNNTNIPLAYRQKMLLKIYEKCLTWFPASVATKRAQKEEGLIAGRCFSKSVYHSAAVSVIIKLRKENESNGLSDD